MIPESYIAEVAESRRRQYSPQPSWTGPIRFVGGHLHNQFKDVRDWRLRINFVEPKEWPVISFDRLDEIPKRELHKLISYHLQHWITEYGTDYWEYHLA